MTRGRGVVAGCALGATSGWNFGNLGGIASELADVYGVGLATIGLLTTAMVMTHLAIQIPGGKASDRFGPARAGAVALAVICAGNALALGAPEPGLALGARAIVGVGTGLAFISGSALVRESGGGPLGQGVFGGVSLAPGGIALAAVPQLEEALGWRAPYWTAVGLALLALAAVLMLAPRRSPARTARRRVVGRGSGPWPSPSGDPLRRVVRPRRGARQLGRGASAAPRRHERWRRRCRRRPDPAPGGGIPAAGRLDPARASSPSARGGGGEPCGRSRRDACAPGRRPGLACRARRGARRSGGGHPILTRVHRGRRDAARHPGGSGRPRQRRGEPRGSRGDAAGRPGFSLPGDGRLGFAVLALLWGAALAALPSQVALGVRTAASP